MIADGLAQIVCLLFAFLTAALVPFYGLMALITTAAALARDRKPEGGSEKRFLITIPAHDEEQNVAETVRSCLAVDYDPSRVSVLVVADNCSDATAQEARLAGAEVIERIAPERRGKGFAIGYAIETLRQRNQFDHFDAIVVVDADTIVDPGLLKEFAGQLECGHDWVQGYYTVRNPDVSWRTELMTYALGLFNGVWTLGEDALGLGAGFRGNGMCLATRGLKRVPWDVHGLTEDQEFSWLLRIAGERVRFAPRARVFGEMVSRGEGARSQRRRWETGRSALRERFTTPWLRVSGVPWSKKVLGFLDLLMPPLTTLAVGLAAVSSMHPLAMAFPSLGGVSLKLLPWHMTLWLILLAYLASPFLVMGMSPKYLMSLFSAPSYVAWKLATLATGRAGVWERTGRERP